MSGRVLLVRHGATEFNSQSAGESAERIRGWLEIPLDAEGIKEADRLARELRGRDVESLYSSPLERARETANRIAVATKVKPHPNISLLPWNLGKMQGELVATVIKHMAHYVEHEDESPPGGEPFASYKWRFLSFLSRKLEDAAEIDEGAFIVLVTHSRCLQLTKAWIKGGSKDDYSIDVAQMNNYDQESPTGGMIAVSP